MHSLASYKKNPIKNRLCFNIMLKKNLTTYTFYICSVIATDPCFNTSIIRNQGIDAPMKVNKWLHCLLCISEDRNDSSRANETWFLTSLCLLKHSNAPVSVPAITTACMFSPSLMKHHLIFWYYFQLLLHFLPCRGRVSLCYAQFPAKPVLTHWPICPSWLTIRPGRREQIRYFQEVCEYSTREPCSLDKCGWNFPLQNFKWWSKSFKLFGLILPIKLYKVFLFVL